MSTPAELHFSSAAAAYALADDAVFLQSLTTLAAWSIDHDPEAARRGLAAAYRELFAQRSVHSLSFELRPQQFAEAQIPVTLQPPAQHHAWRRPITITLPAFAYQHDGRRWTLVVPSLPLEYPAEGKTPPFALLAGLLHRGLRRTLRGGASLPRLAALAAMRQPELLPLRAAIPHLPPADAVRHEQRRKPNLPLLERLLRPPQDQPALPTSTTLEPVAQRLSDCLGRGRSALLVGPSGVGKTLLAQYLARHHQRLGLSARKFRFGTGTQLLTRCAGLGLDWRQGLLGLAEAAPANSVVLCLGSLAELLSIGPAFSTQASLASVLLPFLVRGQVLAVVEATPEQWAQVERDHPGQTLAYERIELTPPDAEGMLAVLRTALPRPAEAPAAAESDGALRRLDRLFRRFAPYAGQPRAALCLLRDWQHANPDATLDDAAVLGAFANLTGIPTALLDDRVPLDLPATQAFFAARVRHQDEAVRCIVDRISQWKADLARPGKPLASLLFLGPTGVGKTELCKALAEYLFGSRDRLLRFDMSEFGDPVAMLRLIGGPNGEGQLTARIREQPFAVVLFDEFEKADPSFLDLLLQLLGEGRLTDRAGRTGWFQQAVVILTSNLGAETFSVDGLGFGQRDAAAAARHHYEQALRRHLRPELWNRLDAWVPFQPLGAAAARELVAMQVAKLHERPYLAARRVALEVPDDVLQQIAADGVDPQFGARPLQRAVDRSLVRVLGCALLYPVPTGTLVRAQFGAGSGELRAVLEFTRTDPKAGEALARSGALRRAAAALASSAAMREVRSTLERLASAPPAAPAYDGVEATREVLAELDERCRALVDATAQREEQLFLAEAGEPATGPRGPAAPATAADALEQALLDMTCDLAVLDEPQPDRCWLWLHSVDPARLAQFCDAYGQVLGDDSVVQAEGFAVLPAQGTQAARMVRWRASDPFRVPNKVEGATAAQCRWLAEHGPSAVLLHLRGRHAALRFAAETGQQLWCKNDHPRHDVGIHVRAMTKAALQEPRLDWFSTGRPCQRKHAVRTYQLCEDGNVTTRGVAGDGWPLRELLQLVTSAALQNLALRRIHA